MHPFTVIHEDNHLLIVNKAAGVLVQGDATGDEPLSELVKNWLREKYQKPGNIFCGVVHRLDRPVSGLVVLAKTSKALERMNKLFREKDIQKTYWALVEKRPEIEEGHLTHWLVKNNSKNITTAYKTEVNHGLKSELKYKLLISNERDYLLEVSPLTGRPHQIRVQLASMGCPIKGDKKYGSTTGYEAGYICLHARKIEFEHPITKNVMVFEAPLPDYPAWKKLKLIVNG